MVGDWKGNSEEIVEAALFASFESPVMIKDWLVVATIEDISAEGIGSDSGSQVAFLSSRTTRRVVSMGMLQYALVVEQRAIINGEDDL